MNINNIIDRVNEIIEESNRTLVVAKFKKLEKFTSAQEWIYLVHHFHPPEKEQDMEILHHCFMYTEKEKKGDKVEQKHKRSGKIFLHTLDIEDIEDAPKVVYDHLNNGFTVKIKTIDKKKYAVIDSLVNAKKTKWSTLGKVIHYDNIPR